PTVVRVRHDSTQTAQREADEGSASAVASAALTTRASTPRSPTAAVRREVRLRPQSEGARTTTSRSVAEAHRNALATGAASSSRTGTDSPATSTRLRWTCSRGSARQWSGTRAAAASDLSEHSIRSPPGGNDEPSIPASTDAGATTGSSTAEAEAEATASPEHDRSTASTVSAARTEPVTTAPTPSAPGGCRRRG